MLIQATCAGCACLCDDIVVEKNGEFKVKNACRRGAGIFLNYLEGRAKPSINGETSSLEEAIERASEIIADSKKLAVYGMDTITLEAQKLAIKIAEKTDAFIDDCSSFCLGNFVEACLRGEIPTTTLDYVRDNAYVIIYWGANPVHSSPRHMSRYSYFPRGKNRQRGYEEDRFLVVIDVRKDHTSKIVKKNEVFIEPESDAELIDSFVKIMEGKAAKYSGEVAGILREIKKGDAVVFGGLGLRYGLEGDFKKFYNLLRKLNEFSKVYFIPAGFHSNMRGFNESLFEKTGYVNRYSFGEQTSRKEFEFSKLLTSSIPDTTLIIGSDPVNSLPFDVSMHLSKINTITIDPRRTFTTEISDVVIPSSISGVENGGTMVRSDGVKIKLNSVFENKFDDTYILERILERI
jgi:formylmethanofuran dehydrogenase subunit B